MNTSYIESPCVAIGKDKWKRTDRAKIVSDFETRDKTVSQREFAQKTNVPQSTLRFWLARKNGIDAHPALIEFFESPVGIAFLHRLVTFGSCFVYKGWNRHYPQCQRFFGESRTFSVCWIILFVSAQDV